jgi:hypothetical protein
VLLNKPPHGDLRRTVYSVRSTSIGTWYSWMVRLLRRVEMSGVAVPSTYMYMTTLPAGLTTLISFGEMRGRSFFAAAAFLARVIALSQKMKLEADNWLKGEERGTTKYNSPGGSAFGDLFPQRFRVRLKKNNCGSVWFFCTFLSCSVFLPVLFWVSFSKRFGFLRGGNQGRN